MTPNEYQELAQRTECDQKRATARIASMTLTETSTYLPHQLTLMRLNHSIIGMAGEVGELASVVEGLVYYGKSADFSTLINLHEELGDLLWYVAEACNAIGIGMEDVMKSNIEKLRKRYPEKYSDDLAANRNLEAEREALCNEEQRRADAGLNSLYQQNGHGWAEPLIHDAECRCVNCLHDNLGEDQ